MGYRCDHCKQAIHPDSNDYFVGEDETSDCPVNAGGHEWEGHVSL